MKKIEENRKGLESSSLFPFFWQHGESLEVIKTYMDKMQEQGIHNVCIESRPHPDFLKEGWWKTMDFIVDYAKCHKMKLWILDDCQFPTGYANGKVPESLKKRYLNIKRLDFAGPNTHAEINLSILCDGREFMKDQRHKEDKLLKAYLCENEFSSYEAYKLHTIVDVTDCYQDGLLNLSLQNHHYTLIVLYITSVGNEETTKDYLDPMNAEATKILLNEVYEKHFDHYGDQFGSTITGFFSDEPRFGNTKGPDASIGRFAMPLPWNGEVHQRLKAIKDYDDSWLIGLYFDHQESSRIRFEYMNIVSSLYSECFSQVIGDWCEDHHVSYIGHVIEDNNAHGRLGYGAGHYFRAMAGQHMAGIDVIGGQIVPGMDYHHTAFSTGGSDGEFYHHALVNLGASCAKLDPRKKGQLMCEAFGAYGWVEGLKMMQWITNHLLSHGVNVIVPHAFDPKAFPDWDCPPHFYAHGNNPQYPYFHYWSAYANRMCHLLSDGYKKAEIGVLYHAFAEWSGDYMLMQKPLKILDQSQISADIISEDYLIQAQINPHDYSINGYTYKVLIVPYASHLPESLIQRLEELAEHVEVIFIDDYPMNYHGLGTVTSLENLEKDLSIHKDIILDHPCTFLTCYHYVQEDGDIYLLNNESITQAIDVNITLPASIHGIYDGYTNQLYALSGTTYHLHLEPYECLTLVSQETKEKTMTFTHELIKEVNYADLAMRAYNGNSWTHIGHVSLLDDLATKYQLFSGTLRYRFDIDIQDTKLEMILPEVYEVVQVKVNGMDVGTRIAPSYHFNLSKTLQTGKNHIEIDVVNNLSRHMRDMFSVYIPLEPLGIRQAIQFYK